MSLKRTMTIIVPLSTLLLLLIVQVYSTPYELFHLSETKFPQAKCLDGSQGSYYFRPGSGSGADKWMIMMSGGGWCWDLEDCLLRSQGDMGSSKPSFMPHARSVPTYVGVLDTAPGSSPLWNYNSVIMNYCDGGSFAGSATVEHAGTTLHFRGKDIRDATVRALQTEHSMDAASDVVVSGQSAGGLAVFLGLDTMAAQIHRTSPQTRVVGLPDAGVFLDMSSPLGTLFPEQDAKKRRSGLNPTGQLDFGYSMRDINTLMNIEGGGGSNVECVRARGSAPSASTIASRPCVFAQYLAPYIATPFFLIQSQYDSWSIGHIYGASDAAGINQYGYNLTMTVRKILSDKSGVSRGTGVDVHRGGFLDSCFRHTTGVPQWEGAVRDAQHRSPSQVFTIWYTSMMQWMGHPSRLSKSGGAVVMPRNPNWHGNRSGGGRGGGRGWEVSAESHMQMRAASTAPGETEGMGGAMRVRAAIVSDRRRVLGEAQPRSPPMANVNVNVKPKPKPKPKAKLITKSLVRREPRLGQSAVQGMETPAPKAKRHPSSGAYQGRGGRRGNWRDVVPGEGQYQAPPVRKTAVDTGPARGGAETRIGVHAPDKLLSREESRQGRYHRPKMLPQQHWADRGYPTDGYPVQGYDSRHLRSADAGDTTVHTADGAGDPAGGGVVQLETLPRVFLAVDAHPHPCKECCNMY